MTTAETREEEEETYSSQHGATVTLTLEDGRLDAELSPTTIRVSPVEGERNMFYVRLRTSHYSFSIKNTCVVRSLQSFYQLRAILKNCHNYLTIPSLPLHASTWVSSYQSISSSLADFLSQVLSLRELLSNKALHLYLQSRLSMEKIKLNVDGKRDDDVALAVSDIIRDERNIAREGFGVLFGDGSSCS